MALSRTSTSFRAFKEIAERRRQWKHFDKNKPIPHEVLEEIMEISQRAPSSFNFHPYKVVLVRDAEYKLKLSKAMLDPTDEKPVLEADATAAFLADVESVDNIEHIQVLYRSTTTAPKNYIDETIPLGIKVSVMWYDVKQYTLDLDLIVILNSVGDTNTSHVRNTCYF